MAGTNGNGRTAERFFDLDAARLARLEAKGEAPTIRFGGETFTLPVEMPVEFGYLLDDSKAAMQVVFGDQFDRFWAHNPTREDINDLIAAMLGMYGLGESAASGGSSSTNGKPSRPTSPGTTSSTSGKRVSGRTR